MSSFPAQAGRVRNVGLPLHHRLLALRECVLHFAPYGFRATWHHLVLRAGIPVSLESDPDSLLRAVAELEDARRLWLAEVQAFSVRRRKDKAVGRRRPGDDDAWYAWPQWLAFCPDPEHHPTEPLVTVVARLIDAYRSGEVPADRCPACERTRLPPHCPHCGARSWDRSAYPWNASGDRPPVPPRASLPWPLIWQRAVRRDTTVGGGDIWEFRAEYTPTSNDGRFGIFQLYVRGNALGDATTTALYPHIQDLQTLVAIAEWRSTHGPKPLILGDTFDHLTITLETTEQDMVFAFTTRPKRAWGEPPPWAPPPGRRMRLIVRRAEVISAWREAEPELRRFLTHA
ncbi:hypothetical protein ACWT_5989 [Actinoplanes sp. SE50]|nr:hypothetical protein ACPL_6121 [Actinoplanes sp. SE50/110]ATO85404.1 hypothetical protein ACWT_5989 [Actinoplanes sp. SE50]SLM02816.1 hypothetical protein ACSP50_6101 [Actinoplanes sp. SE50/110]